MSNISSLISRRTLLTSAFALTSKDKESKTKRRHRTNESKERKASKESKKLPTPKNVADTSYVLNDSLQFEVVANESFKAFHKYKNINNVVVLQRAFEWYDPISKQMMNKSDNLMFILDSDLNT